MNIEKYPVITGQNYTTFEFVSEGIRGRISKLVVYSETHLHNFYNLGFGDKVEETGDIDDEVITNNGDSEKVLATVASTLYVFMEEFADAMVYVTGSTKARTRLYRIGIGSHLTDIQKDFDVYGLTDAGWHPFRKNTEFRAFLVTRKNLFLQDERYEVHE